MVPPVATLYHLNVPLLFTVPDKVKGPASHLEAAVAVTVGGVVKITGRNCCSCCRGTAITCQGSRIIYSISR